MLHTRLRHITKLCSQRRHHNFVFFHLPWQAAAFRGSVQEFTELAEQSAWPAWFLENHDHSRVATRYADEPGSGHRRARTAAMLICTLRGTPFLYYGQELGLPDADIPPDRVVDVDLRDLMLEPDEGLILRLAEGGEGGS